MAFIDIHTNNLTRELTNRTTYIDNWAYVAGVSKTGDWKAPYTFTTLDDFKETCGIGSPEGAKTYEYVAGLLSAGIPVIFRRIACENQDKSNETPLVVKANAMLKYQDPETNEEKDAVEITEKFGGTFGNDIMVVVRNTNIAVWLDVYLNTTVLERKKLISIAANEDPQETATKLIYALEHTSFDRIDIKVVEQDPAKFQLPDQTKTLSGGADFPIDKVVPEIAYSFNYITDKILYQPKFLTMGGFYDTDLSAEGSMTQAMKKLSLERQDCLALIDLPQLLDPDEQQIQAGQASYQQVSDSQPIEAAAVFAPWQYMQVGTSQLWMPASYAYLTTVGSALSKGEKVYRPKAGLASGQITNIIRPEFEIGSDLAERWQSDTDVQLNPIMRLQGSRFVIAGNSTLLRPESNGGEENAFSELSSTMSVIEIRRFVYNLATELQYQYNSATAFETFAVKAGNFLDGMISDGAITKYDITNISTNSEPRKLKIKLDVYITPTIKYIDIFLNISYGSIEMNVGGEA